MKKKTIIPLLLLTIITCALWTTQAQATLLSYNFSGYTNSIILDDGSANAPYLGYGDYQLALSYNAGLTSTATSGFVDSLTGTLSFMQDPNVYGTDPNITDPNVPSGLAINGTDFNLPGGATSFNGIFTELFALTYANSFLSLDFMDPLLQGATPLISINLSLAGIDNFSLLDSFAKTDFTNAQLIPGDVTGTIGNYLTEFSTDTVNYSAPVPEPSTFVLIGVGLAGLGLTRRMRSRKQI